MRIEEIQAADDPRTADYRSVSDPDMARERGWFVAEGRLVLRRILADGRFRLRSVLVSPQACRDFQSALMALQYDVPVYVCRLGDFAGVTGFNIHRGCLALVERPPVLRPEDVLRSSDLVVVLENVANADNVGGVFRNASAFGAGGVLLSPTCCDPLYRKAIRTSMGAALSVPFAWLAGWPERLNLLRAAGFTLVALTPREPSEELDAFAGTRRPQKLALIIGHEGAGLTPAVEAAADVRVRIPMRGGVDSLNLAVASGIALYRLGGPASVDGVRCTE